MRLTRWLALVLRNGTGGLGAKKLLEYTIVAARNSVTAVREQRRFETALRRQGKIKAPLFILGFWRSGTSHLHNLLASDDRFCYPTNYEVQHPHTFLIQEDAYLATAGRSADTTRPMDNVRVGAETPAEDEFALLATTPFALYLGQEFPHRADYYRQFLSFDGASARQVKSWQRALHSFLAKVTFRNGGKRLILKSPGHTARLPILLEMFPDAQFVHIHRNPLSVFQSVARASDLDLGSLDAADAAVDTIIRNYTAVYDAYFRHRGKIPDGQLSEISFSSLQSDPLTELERVYRELNLPAFEHARASIQAHLQSVAGYRKNEPAQIDAAIHDRLSVEWRRSFSEWNYDVPR